MIRASVIVLRLAIVGLFAACLIDIARDWRRTLAKGATLLPWLVIAAVFLWIQRISPLRDAVRVADQIAERHAEMHDISALARARVLTESFSITILLVFVAVVALDGLRIAVSKDRPALPLTAMALPSQRGQQGRVSMDGIVFGLVVGIAGVLLTWLAISVLGMRPTSGELGWADPVDAHVGIIASGTAAVVEELGFRLGL